MVAQHLVSFNSRDVCLKEFFGRDSPPVGGGGCEKTRNDSRGGGGVGAGGQVGMMGQPPPVQGRVKVKRFTL